MSIDQQIADLLAAHQNTPFAWGTFDCCQWALLAAQALTGHSMAVAPYTNARGAMRVLRGLGGYDGALLAYGAEPLSAPSLAQRGDIVLVPRAGLFDGALAVCAGAFAYAAGEYGLVPVPMDKWLKAWRLACRK
jgi:hypothetical protein